MFRSLLYYKYKTFLILLSSVTAIISIFLITALSNGIVTMYSGMLQTNGDIIVTQKGVADTFFSDVNRSLIPKIKTISEVDDVSAIIIGAGSIGIVPIAGIYAVTPNRFRIYKLLSGNYPKNNNEIIIGKKIDIILNHPKDLILFNQNFHISGVFQSDIGFENGGIVMPIVKGEEIFHKSASFLLVTLKNREKAEKVQQKIKLLDNNIKVKTTHDFIENYNQFKIIKISGGVIASVSFFMGFLAIVSIMSIVINDRKYEFGIQRAMGISKGKIIFGVMVETALIIIVAYFIALGLSIVCLEVLQNIDKFQGYLSGEIDFSLAVGVFVGSLVMALFGASIPAYIASNTDPMILITQG